jgi:uncharacterized protein YgiB involved in biofilm formation
MKRTAVLALVSIGAGAVTFYALRDSGRTAEAHVYSTVQDCILAGGIAEQRCRDEYARSQAEHERTAPRYADQQTCEQEFGAGACERRTPPGTSGSVFMPLLAGYMFGTLAANREVATQPLYRARPEQSCPPVAPGQPPPNPCPPQRTGGSGGSSGTAYRTGHGIVIWSGGGRPTTTVSPGATRTSSRPSTTVPRTVASPPPSRPNTVSRNGFGQTSRSVSLSSRSSGT